MSLKDFYHVWKKRDLLKELFKEAGKALDRCEQMFLTAGYALQTNKPLEIDVHKQDSVINEVTTKIRRKVVVHMTVNPKKDPVAFITLVDIARDVERIGDYSKNIADLSELFGKPLGAGLFNDELNKIKDSILKMFRLTREALKKVDEDKAKEVLKWHQKKIDPGIDELIKAIFSKEQIETNEAITSVMYARYMKRISAHLMNISATMTSAYHEVKMK